MSTREIYTAMGYSMETTGFRNCLNDLIEEGTVEYLYPDKPRSSRQKMCLSRKAIRRR